MPGLTRDRHYGDGRLGPRPYFVVDTGGLEPVAQEGLLGEMAKQTAAAIAEADAILFLVDAREGLTPQDRRIAEELRKTHARVWLVANKAEGMDAAIATAEFHELGLGEPHAISAAHGEGVAAWWMRCSRTSRRSRSSRRSPRAPRRGSRSSAARTWASRRW